MDLGEYNKLVEEEVKDLIKNIEEGDVQSFGCDAFFTDEPLAKIHQAYKHGDLTQIGIVIARYIDGCLEERAERHVDDRNDFAKDLAFIATGAIQE